MEVYKAQLLDYLQSMNVIDEDVLRGSSGIEALGGLSQVSPVDYLIGLGSVLCRFRLDTPCAMWCCYHSPAKAIESFQLA